jgi:uncharacterized membrane protein YbhN (UPF0104 family)
MGITIIAVFLGALGWWLILLSLQQEINWQSAARVHLNSNLAKYLPGYAWQLVGKAYLTKQMGVSTGAIGIGMALELLLLVLTGIWVMVVFIPVEMIGNWIELEANLFSDILPWMIVVLSLLLIGLPVTISWFIKKNRKLSATLSVNPRILFAATLSILTGWILFGISFWCLGSSLMPFNFTDIKLFTFTLATSFLVGLAVLFVPGGIGIRESLMVFFLGPFMTGPIAVLVATISRIVLVLCELTSALIMNLYTKWKT